MGKVGVLNASNGTAINAANLTVEGGTGTIGTRKKPLTIAAKVEAARSENNIFIKSPSDLGLGAVYTPKNATFSSSKNIYKLSNLEAAQIDVSGTLTLKGKNIGAVNIPLKIKSSDAISVNVNGANMFLQMPEEKVGNVTIKNTHKNGNLTLKGNINSSGNVTLRANKKILVENNVTAAGNVDIVTVKRDDLTVKGKVTAGGTTRLEAPEGQAVSGKGNPNKSTPQSSTDKISPATSNTTDTANTANTASTSTTDNNSSSAQNDLISENAEPLTENATVADNNYVAQPVKTNATTNNTEVIPLKTGGKFELDLEKNKGYYFPEPDEVVNDYLQDNRNF